MKKIINLTPHTITCMDSNGEFVTFEPSGSVARVSQKYLHADNIGNIVLYDCTYGDVEGLPDVEKDVCYIVSGMVRQALPSRWDLLSPGEHVRDDNGRPIGCIGFVINC